MFVCVLLWQIVVFVPIGWMLVLDVIVPNEVSDGNDDNKNYDATDFYAIVIVNVVEVEVVIILLLLCLGLNIYVWFLSKI